MIRFRKLPIFPKPKGPHIKLQSINFRPKQIAGFFSECLVPGVYTDKKDVVLLQPERKVENGWRIG